jgi:hypothetical protein
LPSSFSETFTAPGSSEEMTTSSPAFDAKVTNASSNACSEP